jgi:hypothetical protein
LDLMDRLHFGNPGEPPEGPGGPPRLGVGLNQRGKPRGGAGESKGFPKNRLSFTNFLQIAARGRGGGGGGASVKGIRAGRGTF